LGSRVQGVFVDAMNEDSLVQVVQGADAAAGCIGPFYRFAPKMAHAAIKAKLPYVDICDDYGPMKELFAMDADAKNAGVTVITGLGWTPGVSNLLVKYGASKFAEVDDIKIAWAGGAADSQGLAVIMHVAYAVTGHISSYRNSAWVEILAASEPEIVEFPKPFGRMCAFHTGHPEPFTLPRYIKTNNVNLRGTIDPDCTNNLAVFLAKMGWTDTHEMIARVANAIHALEFDLPIGGIPASSVRVEVIGRQNGASKSLVLSATDTMGKLTGIPAAIGAAMLARGEIEQPGVYAPEGVIEPVLFFKELAWHDVNVVGVPEVA
jgi:saccharopine dehydrogenase-like NADP-dependent oxidoreductase